MTDREQIRCVNKRVPRHPLFCLMKLVKRKLTSSITDPINLFPKMFVISQIQDASINSRNR